MSRNERLVAVGLVVLWAALFLPKLRTNPNWYGDEGEWMEKSWTLIHGKPRVGPVSNDFVFPYPYPPLYMVVNGALLRLFGNDIVVGRALGAVTALAAAGILFWIGSRLRDRGFGFLCAAAFLVYSEANVNFRWVRSHPMAGTLALASVGFLVRYVQEKKLRDAIWAGVFCALATATNYFTYPLIGAVIVTTAVAGRMPLVQRLGRTTAVAAVACSYAGGFVLWYCAVHGWGQLMAQLDRLTAVAANEVAPTLWGEAVRFVQNVWRLGFHTPTKGPPPGWSGRDWWLVIATAGFVWLPVRGGWGLRVWLPVWLLVLMFGVFRKLNNVPMFFYPATIFLPLMAVGFAGVLCWAGEAVRRLGVGGPGLRVAPPVVVCAVFGLVSARGAWGRFQTKIDWWTQHRVAEAEAAMRYVNERTGAEDFVIVPKQIYWLVKNAGRRSLLTYCARYEGVANDMPTPVLESRERYWFDCRCVNAKYVVMASGYDTARQQPLGIDLVYSSGLAGVAERVEALLEAGWRPVFVGGDGQMAVVNVRGRKWPVAVNGEYLVLSNPRAAG
jgi:4-amino-4-deoxy-L-arabinose transferase-like glycosyltransferase